MGATLFLAFSAPRQTGSDLLEPTHSQAIGLVVADRDPPSPLAAAFVKSCHQLKLENCLDAASVRH